MSKREWQSIDEKDFETILESSISDALPDDIVSEVTPWKKAINRILMGIVLRTVTFNFLCLDYILPAIGTVLSLLGFRVLRRENKWFGACFVITAIRAAYFFPMLIINTFIIRSCALTPSITTALAALSAALSIAEFFCLWRGLRSVQKKVNLPPRTDGALALIIWYAVICFFAFIEFDEIIIAGAMLIAYIFIIRSIFKLSKGLDEAGYSIKPVSVKITDRCIAFAIATALIIGGTSGYLFGNSYKMEWSAVDSSEHTEVENVKSRLIELGFPEYVLNDLTHEDITACDNAARVVVKAEDIPVNKGRREVIREYDINVEHHIEYDTVFDVKELRITGVAVELSGDSEEWVIFHHFLWIVNPGFYGTESIQLWPAYYKAHSECWTPVGEVSGRVLYDENGKTLTAPYYSLENETFASNSVFFGEQTNTDVFATFSMPRKGENCRGYLTYRACGNPDRHIFESWINYTHQENPFQYPVVTAKEKRMTSGGWNDGIAFRTIQEQFLF